MLLLDTNVWFKRYWRLLPAALERRMDAEELAISPVSAIEIATKIRKGHFPGIQPLEQWFSAAIDGYFIAAWTPEIAAAAGADSWARQDPADRIIVHTAKANQFTLAHTDAMIRQAPICVRRISSCPRVAKAISPSAPHSKNTIDL
jgi:PIN domain nuclease of toxin-antitoxin system